MEVYRASRDYRVDRDSRVCRVYVAYRVSRDERAAGFIGFVRFRRFEGLFMQPTPASKVMYRMEHIWEGSGVC